MHIAPAIPLRKCLQIAPIHRCSAIVARSVNRVHSQISASAQVWNFDHSIFRSMSAREQPKELFILCKTSILAFAVPASMRLHMSAFDFGKTGSSHARMPSHHPQCTKSWTSCKSCCARKLARNLVEQLEKLQRQGHPAHVLLDLALDGYVVPGKWAASVGEQTFGAQILLQSPETRRFRVRAFLIRPARRTSGPGIPSNSFSGPVSRCWQSRAKVATENGYFPRSMLPRVFQ